MTLGIITHCSGQRVWLPVQATFGNAANKVNS